MVWSAATKQALGLNELNGSGKKEPEQIPSRRTFRDYNVPWESHGSLVGTPRTHHGSPIGTRKSDGDPTEFLWKSDRDPTEVPWKSKVPWELGSLV